MNNRRGFGLVEVMITAGVLGGLSLVMMNLSKQAATTSARSSADLDVSIIANRVQSLLVDPNSCKNSLSLFGDIRISPTTPITALKDKSNTNIVLDSNSVKVLSINLTNKFLTPVVATDDLAALKVKLLLEKKIMGKTYTVQKEIPVSVVADSGFKVTGCNSSIDAIAAACASLGGIMSGTDCSVKDTIADLQNDVATLTTDLDTANEKIEKNKEKIAELKALIDNLGTTGTVGVVGVGTAAPPCAGKTWSGILSYDTLNSCNYTVGTTPAGSAATVTATNGGSAAISCVDNGDKTSKWTTSFNCPNKGVTPAPPCAAKTWYGVSSSDSSNSCNFTVAVTPAGSTASVIATNGGTASIKCLDNGDSTSKWDYSYTCPNKALPSCIGGNKTFPSAPAGKGSCTYTWSTFSGGTTKTVTPTTTGGATGSGSVSCSTTGDFTYSYVCKDPKAIMCSSGVTAVPSSSGKAACSCSYIGVPAGSSTSGSCTGGGSVSATCSSTGTWTGIVAKCP